MTNNLYNSKHIQNHESEITSPSGNTDNGNKPAIAGNNTTTIDHPSQYISDKPMTKALESRDSNISFSDGYNGYCIEWGEHSAEKGDKFYIHDGDVDNNIKTFFVYFYEASQRDVIATQHMIWKFTDNKQFSQFNQSCMRKSPKRQKRFRCPMTAF